jgi:hypothetical protein
MFEDLAVVAFCPLAFGSSVMILTEVMTRAMPSGFFVKWPNF